MATDRNITPIDPLDLLRVLARQMRNDDVINSFVDSVIENLIAEVERLREVETAALLLADLVLAEGTNIELPTADSTIIQVIRCRQ